MKKYFVSFLFLIVISLSNIVFARDLLSVNNYDYSIEMFNTTYYISYDLDGGTLDRINTYTPENNDFELGIPSKTGYVFLGWTGSNGHIPNPNVTVKQGTVMNLTFEAHWEKIKDNIDYDLNGGSNFGCYIYKDIETGSIILGQPDRVGYAFKGWTGSNGTTPQKTITIPANTMSNLNYKANWELNTYNINFSANDNDIAKATLATNPSTYNVETNDITLNNPTRVAYTFEGWTGTNGKVNQLTVKIPKGSTGDRWYKAHWKVITYNITYDLKGGSGVSNRTYTIETPSFNLPHPSRTGYTFKGYTGSNGSTPQTTVTIYQTYGDKSYAANWEANKYTVTLNKNNGTGGQNTVTATYDSAVPTVTVPSRTGYTFLGYYTTADGGTKYINADGTSAKNWDKAEDTTLYAHWSINSYTVTYKKANGTVWRTKSVTYQEAIPTDTPGGYDSYHRFGKWDGLPNPNKMPAYDIIITEVISETYCYFQTGTASYSNAEKLGQVFKNAGFTNYSLFNSDLGWGAITSQNLTRSQVDALKNTNFSNTNWSPSQGEPWIKWLSINCDNGHGENWARNSGGNSWYIEAQW